MAGTNLYLGQVLKKIDFKTHTVLHIEPLYIESMDTGGWDRLSSDEVDDDFPNRGIVAWFNYPADAVEGSIWQFYVVEQPSYDPENERHDAYKVNTFFPITSPVEIIDVRYLKTIENARVRLSNDGLGLNFCPSQKAYLWVNERTWIGPVQLSPSHEEGYWYLDKKQREHPLKVFSPAYDEMVELDIDGRRWFLKKRAKVGAHRGSVDWGEDEAVLRYALTKAQAEYAHAFTLTKKTITQMLGDLNFNESSMLEEDLGAYRLQRAKNIVEILDHRQSLVQELEASLLNLNVVRALIEEEKKQAREEVEERVRDETQSLISEAEAKVEEVRETEYAVHQTIEKEKQALEQLQQDINEQQQHLRQLEVDIQAKRQEQERMVESLEDTIAERLLTVMEQPQQLLADIAVIKAALNLVPSSNVHQTLYIQQEMALKNDQTLSVSVSPSPLLLTSDSSNQVTALTDLEELRKNFRKSLSSHGLETACAAPIIAASLAGAMPLLTGDDTFEVLRIWSSCIAGGRILWAPIVPTVAEPADLLGKCDNTTRRFIPHSNGFADLLLQAKRHPNDLYVVVLDGINRAIVDTYLSPLLACYRDRFAADHKRMLTLFHPNVVMESDPYYELACFEWPANVLLTGILSEATSTVVPPRTLWDDAVVLLSGGEAIEKSATKSRKTGSVQTDRQKYAVPFEQWQQWLEQGQSNVTIPELIPTLVEKGLMLRRESVALIGRFHEFLTERLKVEGQMVSKLLCQALIPQAIASRQVDLLLEVMKTEKISAVVIEQVQKTTLSMEQVLI